MRSLSGKHTDVRTSDQKWTYMYVLTLRVQNALKVYVSPLQVVFAFQRDIYTHTRARALNAAERRDARAASEEEEEKPTRVENRRRARDICVCSSIAIQWTCNCVHESPPGSTRRIDRRSLTDDTDGAIPEARTRGKRALRATRMDKWKRMRPSH